MGRSMTLSLSSRVAERLASLLGDGVLVLHAPSVNGDQVRLGGRDIDCAIRNLDPMWPLRLGEGWAVCQCSHYDLRGWQWVIDRKGEVMAFDAIDDPLGLGRDGIRTASLVSDGVNQADPAVQAAYLTIKRLRKGDFTEIEWNRVRNLSQLDPAAYREALQQMAGQSFTDLIIGAGLSGSPPDSSVARRARSILFRRRFGSPLRGGMALTMGMTRYIDRIWRPTGMVVLLAGPDGSGKSTLARQLARSCDGLFKQQLVYHWRPGLLPRPGALLRREYADPTKPHNRPPHGRGLSLLLLAYYWMDFLLGEWLLGWSPKVRGLLIIRERGWWDVAVDPRRYRLDVPPRLVRFLGQFLRRPDLVFLLDATPETILSRKKELSAEEVARQTSCWKQVLPSRIDRARVDVSAPPARVADEVRARVVDFLERRTASRLGSGWVNLPSPRSTRWWIPRGRRASVGGVEVHQPVTFRGRLGWEAARALGSLGGFRLLPRGEAPPRAVREALAPYIPRRGTLAVTRANHPGRFVAFILEANGRPHAVAKIATTREGSARLDNEAAMISALGNRLADPLEAPRVLDHEEGLLVLAAVPWRPRKAPWKLSEEIAGALGALFRVGAAEGPTGPVGPSHGDFAPWNLLQTSRGAVLVDWESASMQSMPFFDLWHYLVQSHALLGRPSREAILRGAREQHGWVGRAIHAYAEASGVAASEARALLREYLDATTPYLRPRNRRERAGLTARRRLRESSDGLL